MLLIQIILEGLPDEIRLEISRKLGTQNWQIDPFMNILKEEITARESCDFLKSQMRHLVSEFQEKAGQERHFTTEALYMGAKVLSCVFCGKNHFHDKCNVVTEVAERKQIVWKKDCVIAVCPVYTSHVIA